MSGNQFRIEHDCPDLTEYFQCYCPGGFHPIAIGDLFSQDRYGVVHKLGYSSSCTVWLARDHHQGGRLVALKALRADLSDASNYELVIQKDLQAANPPIPNIQTLYDHFYVDGPNGTHLIIVYRLCGPSVDAVRNVPPGAIDGTKRFRRDLARKIIKQLVGAVHGDITCSNILFSLRPEVLKWTDDQIYNVYGGVVTTKVAYYEGNRRRALPPGVPAKAILPNRYERLLALSATLIEESIILADFRQSYTINNPVHDYKPRTLVHYFPPEAHFENRAGLESDVWMLGCAIFEIRTGWPPFMTIFDNSREIVKQQVAMLGRLPDPWWEQLEGRDIWFSDDGTPKPTQEQKGYPVRKTSIPRGFSLVGVDDSGPSRYATVRPIFEKTGIRLEETEVKLLGDLLEKMLRYKPEDRINLQEVIQHPYLEMCE